ncbi:MAG TPA: ATP-binding protein [Ramlibacter sp.]|nr:ATP-binding protein [Ramlibacter sp.]
MTPPLHQLVGALGDETRRQQAASDIAHLAGARELLLFVRDPELQVFVPAPGMPKTLPGAAAWRQMLAGCGDRVQVNKLEIAGQAVIASAAVVEECAFVLVGEQQCEFPQLLADSMQLLSAALRAQQSLRLEVAAAAEARNVAAQARQLAHALDSARAAAAELNHQLQNEHERKDQFLAMLAHELRNPLAPMTSALEIVRRTSPREIDDRVRRQLDVMARQVQQLTHLVDDLLDVSRVSRGLIELRREVLPLRDLLRSAIESSRPLLDSRRHLLVIPPIAEEVQLDGDVVRLTQVFANLLNNAAKYTDPGGRITLDVALCGEKVEVAITDTGHGIPPEMLASIFDMFTQVPGSLDRAPGGLGIGLTLVRTLVELHGGSVRAESAGLGTGSRFVVTLPLAIARAEAPPSRVSPEVALSRSLVMIVDDNVDAALSLSEVLKLIGADTAVAHEGAQALSMAAAGMRPGIVLMDIGLPGMDGYETAREWRRRFGRDAKLVALTGYGSADDRRRSAQAGFDEHLVKPVALDMLLKVLNADGDPATVPAAG